MNKFNRRRMLLAMSAAPVSMLASGYSFASVRNLSVAEAMRYLCEEVFPSVHQRRHESGDGDNAPSRLVAHGMFGATHGG